MDLAPSPSRHSHAADDVFDRLAAAILRGDMPPGSPLPPERVLAEKFGLSRVIARQAVHRLAEMGLVRVRQGGATLVLDPRTAKDLRVIALFYKYAPASSRGAADVVDMIEKQFLQGLSIVEVASRRASKEDLAALLRLVDRAAAAPEAAPFDAFETRFWLGLADAAKNRVFRMEVSWWYETLTDRPVAAAVAARPLAERYAFYRELARCLHAGENAVAFYLAVVRPVLDGEIAQLGEAASPTPARTTSTKARR